MISFKDYFLTIYAQIDINKYNEIIKQGYYRFWSFFLTNVMIVTFVYTCWFAYIILSKDNDKITWIDILKAYGLVSINFTYIGLFSTIVVTVGSMMVIYLLKFILRSYFPGKRTFKEYGLCSLYLGTFFATFLLGSYMWFITMLI